MYQVGNFVEMKKPHACTIKSTGKKANRWEITRVGADIKIKCSNCDHLVMMFEEYENTQLEGQQVFPFCVIILGIEMKTENEKIWL